MNYGLPYIGSKNQIVKKILNILPPAETFVDLFAGGGAITHYAAITGKYKQIIYNDYNPMISDAFHKAINGNLCDSNYWVSRDEFNKRKNDDAYVALCFSFGYNMRNYAFSTEKEALIKAIYEAIYGDVSGFNALGYDASIIDGVDGINARWSVIRKYMEQKGKRIRAIEPISRHKRILDMANIPNKDNITICNKDYQDIVIPENSIVYCDIPYKGTGKYFVKGRSADFDYERFYKFALECKHPIYISEYDMPSDFIPIASLMRQERFSSNKTITLEKIFVPKTQYKGYNNISIFDTLPI